MGRMKFNTDTYSKEVNKINNEYKLMSEYVNIKTKVTLLHKKCNKTFEIFPYNFKQGHGCPYCNGNKSKQIKAKNDFIDKFNKIGNNEYELLSDYVSSREYIEIKHKKCNHIYKVTPSNFLAGYKCPKCSKIKKSNDTFLNEIKKLYGNEYQPIDEYINSKTKIRVLHTKCNNIWNVRPDDLLRGYGCPNCQQSKGEKKISNWLKKKNYDFETQFTFKDLYDKNKNSLLRFDFKLSCEDGSIILIEYDGIQHFKQDCFNNTKEDFESIIRKDNLKNEYCKKHNITLYRIKYTDLDSIDTVLNEIFKEYK